MKDFFVNVVSSLLIAAAGWAFNRYALGNAAEGASQFWSILAVVALIGALFVTVRFNRLRDAYVAAHSIDYKFFADPACDKDGALENLCQMFGRDSIEAFGDNTVTKKAGTDGYIPARRFFAKDSPFMQPGLFECHAVRNGKKAGKIFVQMSFVPIDAEGRTLIVRCDPMYHGSEFGGRKKPYLSFLSFSPIPTRFHVNSFDPADAYRNEVPEPWGPFSGTKSAFQELGAAIRFGNENKATYLFYVFAVRYDDVRFAGRTGRTPNIKWLFYKDDNAWKKRLPFGKDHDSIATVAFLDELLPFMRRGTLPSAAKDAPLRERFRVLRLCSLLRKNDFKDMERQALLNLLHTNGAQPRGADNA